MYIIHKEFDFCYGHRVHNQSLNSDLSLDSCLVCRHFHGHQGKISVHLQADELKDGMVTDFKHLNWFKKWIDDVLDHKMILDINDPALKTFFPLFNYLDFPSRGETVDHLCQYHSDGYFTVWMDHLETFPLYEFEIYEGLVLVPFVPTSENLSKWLFEIVDKKIGHLCKVAHVEFKETPKTSSTYFG